jgi:hypothetical protein
MNKFAWRDEYINKIKETNWKKKSFSVNKVQFGGPLNTLSRLAPSILRLLKKPY